MMKKVTIVNESMQYYFGELVKYEPVVYDSMEYAKVRSLGLRSQEFSVYEVEPNFWVKVNNNDRNGVWFEVSFTEVTMFTEWK